jgi:4-amino-4-deoxy-L-arabinose transferase-like glycosyltransferase
VLSIFGCQELAIVFLLFLELKYMAQSNRIHIWGSLIVFLLVSYFSLFHQLAKQPMHAWDESSYALNAQEMIESGNPIEVYLLGQPDLYNSKPPFAIWCMAACIKVLGFNELGVRMASAIFALFSALLLWFVGIKIIKNYWIALTLPLVLLSSFGFEDWHIARTGDTDCVLAFWILLQSILMLGYTNSDSTKKATNYLILAGFAISFACLTKGIGGLTAIPGIIAWLMYTRKLKATFLNKGFYIAYYWLRNHLTPNYFQAVLQNEIGGRLERQDFLNKKTLPFYFYFDYMVTQGRFYVWIIILPFSIMHILTRKKDAIKDIGVFFIFIFTGISILLALSRTKVEWYDAPLYPLMAVIIGISFSILISEKGKEFALLFICIFCWPYYKVVANNLDAPKGHSIGRFIRQIRASGHKQDSIRIINSNADFVLYFYAKKDCLNGNFSDVITHEDPSLTTGSYILTQQYERDVDVNRLFLLQPILRYDECAYYKILGRK